MQRYQPGILTSILCAGLLGVALAGCGGSGESGQPDRLAAETFSPGKQDLSWTDIDKRTTSRAPRNRNLVIRDADQWIALWNQHAPDDPAPKIDFSRHMLIAAFGPGGSTLCSNSAITAMTLQSDKLVVVRTDTEVVNAKIACLTSISMPGHIVAVERLDVPVEFVVKQQTL